MGTAVTKLVSLKQQDQQNCLFGLLLACLGAWSTVSWGKSPERQRGPGKPHILQEGNPKSAELGYPHVPEVGKKTSLLEERALAGTCGTKELITFGRKGSQLRRRKG